MVEFTVVVSTPTFPLFMNPGVPAPDADDNSSFPAPPEDNVNFPAPPEDNVNFPAPPEDNVNFPGPTDIPESAA